MFSILLNEYHLQFLHHLTGLGVRFLIIGGQARHVHDGSATRDLDLWVDIDPGSIPALEKALVQWSELHQSHTHRRLTSQTINLRPGVQQKFPDADCWFMTRANEPREILEADRIDVLTSIKDHRFDIFYARAFSHRVDGIDLPFLSKDDLPVISPRERDGGIS